MPKYRTDVDRWLSHENRIVKAGDEFETTFPKGMKLGDTLHLVKSKSSSDTTVADIKAKLEELEIEYPANAKKSELEALLPEPGTDDLV